MNAKLSEVHTAVNDGAANFCLLQMPGRALRLTRPPFNVFHVSLPQAKWKGREVASHLCVVPKLRMSGAIQSGREVTVHPENTHLRLNLSLHSAALSTM
jgi:hypothetical protein